MRIIAMKYCHRWIGFQVESLDCPEILDSHIFQLHDRPLFVRGSVRRNRSAINTRRGCLRCIAMPSQ